MNEVELKREGNILKIADKKLPISVIDNVFIFSNAHMTKGARSLLLKNNRAVFFIKKYELEAILLPPYFDSNYKCRLKQYENFQNIEIAKFIVLKKIEAIEKFVNRRMNKYKEMLNECKTLNQILGIEGLSSRYMYEKFRELLKSINIDEFKKRAYNPAPDRINGLLSFLYTLYYAFLHSEVIALGFDPFIGFLHIKRGKHSVFVSDMMEEARVLLTNLTYEILRDLGTEIFNGKYLSKDGKKEVLKKFDKFILNYENVLLKELKEKLC
jgi:CRISPR-associated protein Cas1